VVAFFRGVFDTCVLQDNVSEIVEEGEPYSPRAALVLRCRSKSIDLVTLNRCSAEMDSWNFVGPVNAMGMSVRMIPGLFSISWLSYCIHWLVVMVVG
jgi:hypothetical protein